MFCSTLHHCVLFINWLELNQKVPLRSGISFTRGTWNRTSFKGLSNGWSWSFCFLLIQNVTFALWFSDAATATVLMVESAICPFLKKLLFLLLLSSTACVLLSFTLPFLPFICPSPFSRVLRALRRAPINAFVMTPLTWWTAGTKASSTFPGASHMAPGCWSWEATTWAISALEPLPDCGRCGCWCWPIAR